MFVFRHGWAIFLQHRSEECAEPAQAVSVILSGSQQVRDGWEGKLGGSSSSSSAWVQSACGAGERWRCFFFLPPAHLHSAFSGRTLPRRSHHSNANALALFVASCCVPGSAWQTLLWRGTRNLLTMLGSLLRAASTLLRKRVREPEAVEPSAPAKRASTRSSASAAEDKAAARECSYLVSGCGSLTCRARCSAWPLLPADLVQLLANSLPLTARALACFCERVL